MSKILLLLFFTNNLNAISAFSICRMNNPKFLKHVAFKGVEYAHVISKNYHEESSVHLSRHGIHEHFNETSIYAFRGTIFKNIRDWKINLNSKLVPFPYDNDNSSMRVHRGFLNEYENRRSEILNVIREEEKDEILVTGYSAGGALATFLALDVVKNINNIKVNLITFGMPKIGNSEFKSFLENQDETKLIQTHYLLKDDPIDMFPLSKEYKSIIKHDDPRFKICLLKNYLRSHSLSEYSKI